MSLKRVFLAAALAAASGLAAAQTSVPTLEAPPVDHSSAQANQSLSPAERAQRRTERRQRKADRAKLKADRASGNTAALEADKAQMRADKQNQHAERGTTGAPHAHGKNGTPGAAAPITSPAPVSTTSTTSTQ